MKNKNTKAPNAPHHHHLTEEEMLAMDDDIDVIKIGSWMNMRKGFKNKNKLFIYWIILCFLSTAIQIYFYFKIIKQDKIS